MVQHLLKLVWVDSDTIGVQHDFNGHLRQVAQALEACHGALQIEGLLSLGGPFLTFIGTEESLLHLAEASGMGSDSVPIRVGCTQCFRLAQGVAGFSKCIINTGLRVVEVTTLAATQTELIRTNSCLFLDIFRLATQLCRMEIRLLLGEFELYLFSRVAGGKFTALAACVAPTWIRRVGRGRNFYFGSASTWWRNTIRHPNPHSPRLIGGELLWLARLG